MVVAAAVLFYGICTLVSISIVSANPNEWLLVISGGELKSAGVGTTAVLGPFDKAVVFPAAIRKVEFTAQQVSKEMQGIEVSGFLVWAVNRVDDGPFKAYKYGMVGSPELAYQADANIRGMAESIIRHQVANLEMATVIANRELMRNTVRAEMQKVVQGWGMWLETVEVTDVRVLSQRVFDDLQVDFRQKLHFKADTIRMETARDLAVKQLEQDSAKERLETEARAEQAKRNLWIELENAKQVAAVQEQSQELERERLSREHALSLLRAKHEAEVQDLMVQEQIKLAKLKADADLEIQKRQIEVDRTTPPATLQRNLLQSSRDIFSQLPIHDVKIFNSGSGKSLESLLPGLAQVAEMMKGEKE